MKKIVLTSLMALVFAVCSFGLAGCSQKTIDEQIFEELDTGLKDVQSGALNSELAKSYTEASGFNAQEYGMDGTELIQALLRDFTYEIGEIKVDEGAGKASVTVNATSRNLQSAMKTFAEKLQHYIAEHVGKEPLEDMMKQTGPILIESIEETPTTKHEVIVPVTRSKTGEWEIDESAIAELLLQTKS
ncbi:hypothetical protein KPC83_00410 [Collinsella sp. zg1085]|uniref:hypothetical protein n=1 Tax=Collinsella sp. zg1085 TaxID=2844380 RepID=UPI001C0C8BB1|nr:hypothetical protein [Collinsella sp. zg1085]QWT17673.1 hypothetical protein KPC83_00410 [Collinsella sp. zg1085]